MLGLRRRFEQETTYTRVGPVLMAVNPNRVLPEKPGPHVTDVALAAMRGAVDEGRSQAVVISGESGAGKTVSATKIIEFLISRSSHDTGRKSFERRELAKEELLSRLKASIPALEALGNAGTALNENSSRFGKLVTLTYAGAGRRLRACGRPFCVTTASSATASASASVTGANNTAAITYFYNDVYEVELPEGHRFPMEKYRLVSQLLQRVHAADDVAFAVSPLATLEELATTHDREYARRYRWWGHDTMTEEHATDKPYYWGQWWALLRELPQPYSQGSEFWSLLTSGVAASPHLAGYLAS